MYPIQGDVTGEALVKWKLQQREILGEWSSSSAYTKNISYRDVTMKKNTNLHVHILFRDFIYSHELS